MDGHAGRVKRPRKIPGAFERRRHAAPLSGGVVVGGMLINNKEIRVGNQVAGDSQRSSECAHDPHVVIGRLRRGETGERRQGGINDCMPPKINRVPKFPPRLEGAPLRGGFLSENLRGAAGQMQANAAGTDKMKAYCNDDEGSL